MCKCDFEIVIYVCVRDCNDEHLHAIVCIFVSLCVFAFGLMCVCSVYSKCMCLAFVCCVCFL